MSALLLAALAIAAPEAMPAKRLAVLPSIVAGETGRATSQQVYDATANTSGWRLGLETLSYNELFIDGTDPIAKQLRACGAQAPCLAKVMGSHRIDSVLTVIVNFAVEPPLVTLGLIDGRTGDTVLSDVAELSGRPLEMLLAERCEKILDDAGFQRAGEATVTVQPAGGVVEMADGTLVRRTEAQSTFRAVPGTYRVDIRREGHESTTREVTIVSGRNVAVDVILTPVEVEETLVEKPWFWVVIGAAAAGAATAAVVVATSGGDDVGCLCVATPNSPCGTCGN